MAKIMIIEDDSLLIKMYQTKFQLEGYEMMTATDGEQGLKLLKADKPDFLILDMMMPKLSGLELLAIIRNDPGLKDLPVFMLSNMSQPSEMEKAKALGVVEFVLKSSLTPRQVVDKVRKYLRKTGN